MFSKVNIQLTHESPEIRHFPPFFGAFYIKDLFPLYQGNTVGNKKICCVADPFAEQNPLLGQVDDGCELRLKITTSRDVPVLKEILIF